MRALAGASLTLVAMLAAAGCSEAPQQLDAARKGSDSAWKGAGGAYAAPGWTAGDAKSWETQIRNRAQRGQDEYPRSGGAS